MEYIPLEIKAAIYYGIILSLVLREHWLLSFRIKDTARTYKLDHYNWISMQWLDSSLFTAIFALTVAGMMMMG